MYRLPLTRIVSSVSISNGESPIIHFPFLCLTPVSYTHLTDFATNGTALLTVFPIRSRPLFLSTRLRSSYMSTVSTAVDKGIIREHQMEFIENSAGQTEKLKCSLMPNNGTSPALANRKSKPVKECGSCKRGSQNRSSTAGSKPHPLTSQIIYGPCGRSSI